MNRYGEKWSEQEENQLLSSIKLKSIGEISNQHKRSQGAINSRLKYIAVRMYNNGSEIDEIINITTLKESVILDSIDRNEKKKSISPENIAILQNRIIELLEEKLYLNNEINKLKLENQKLKLQKQ
jgi:hypothetical protein